MSDAADPDRGHALPDPAPDLLAASPRTAYFWGRVAGDGDLTSECVTVRVGDGDAADALASIAGLSTGEAEGDRSHDVRARESAHDASIVRHEDEHELRVFGATADRASAAFGLPTDGQPGGYRFGAFEDHRADLVRGLLEAAGTVCFRESAGDVGVSFVHDDRRLLETVRSEVASAPPAVPTDDLQETSSGGYWFGLGDDADVAAFARWAYDGTDESGLYAPERRRKLFRSVERATGAEVGAL
jgi:hypothetical protein